jgi:hypothetical protein
MPLEASSVQLHLSCLVDQEGHGHGPLLIAVERDAWIVARRQERAKRQRGLNARPDPPGRRLAHVPILLKIDGALIEFGGEGGHVRHPRILRRSARPEIEIVGAAKSALNPPIGTLIAMMRWWFCRRNN